MDFQWGSWIRKTSSLSSGVVHHSWKHTHHKVIKMPLSLFKNSCNHYESCCSKHPNKPNIVTSIPGEGLFHLAPPMLLQRCTQSLVSNGCVFAALVSSYGSCHRFLLGPTCGLFIHHGLVISQFHGDTHSGSFQEGLGIFLLSIHEMLFQVSPLPYTNSTVLLLWGELLSTFSFSGNMSLCIFCLFVLIRHYSLFWS